MSDTGLELLARYSRDRAEDAFAEIVRRHLDLVHSAALRQVRSPQLAEEVAQSTFFKLAQHARQLAPDTTLCAWLYQVTRREAIDVVRREARRQLREQIAPEVNAMNATAADWTHIEPLLDEAMHALDETDRAAVLLRCFENRSLHEIGHTLGASVVAVVISAQAVQAALVGSAVSISAAIALAGTAETRWRAQPAVVPHRLRESPRVRLQRPETPPRLPHRDEGVGSMRQASNVLRSVHMFDSSAPGVIVLRVQPTLILATIVACLRAIHSADDRQLADLRPFRRPRASLLWGLPLFLSAIIFLLLMAGRGAAADIGVQVSFRTNVFRAGVTHEATITVTNLGPDQADDVELWFLASEGQEYVGPQTAGEASGGWRFIRLGGLPALEQVTASVLFRPVTAGEHHLIAQVSQPGDPDAENSYALAQFTAQPGAGVIQFEVPEQSVSEQAGHVAVLFHRREGAQGLVTVAYLVHDETAIAGVHHTGTNGQLTFNSGEAVKTLRIPLLQNSLSECSREFRLLLQGASGGALVRNITNHLVTILDDDVSPAGSLETVSISSNRLDSGNGFSGPVSMTPDGRWAAFGSFANDLANISSRRPPQVYVRDLVHGITRQIAPSPSSNATPASEAYAGVPALSADGRYVVFIGAGDGWVTNTLPPFAEQVFWHDTVTRITQLITITPTGGGSDGLCPSRINGSCYYAGVSDDGQRVLFFNNGAAMSPLNSNGVEQLYLRDVPTQRTVAVSSNHFGNGLGNGPVWEASLSADGNVVAFASDAANLVAGFSYVIPGIRFPDTQIYVRDLRSNVTVAVTRTTNATYVPGPSSSPIITRDGRFVIFRSWNNALVPNDDHDGPDLFRFEIATGRLLHLTRATPGENTSPSVSADGRFVAYRNGRQTPRDAAQIFLFDCASNTTTLVSVNCHGTGPGNRHSLNPVISADGAFVYFQSCALDLTPGIISDTYFSVYRRDLARQTTELISLNRELTGTSEGNTGTVSVSPDGHRAILNSEADDLVWGDNNFTADLFLWRAGRARESGPRLVIERTPEGTVTRWPGGLADFVLQTNPSLSPANWMDLLPANSVSEWRTTNSARAFFRLRR